MQRAKTVPFESTENEVTPPVSEVTPNCFKAEQTCEAASEELIAFTTLLWIRNSPHVF